MPEGDTLFRIARTLTRAIGGQVISALRSTQAELQNATLTGFAIDRVEARGKNLLIVLSDGRAIRSHLGMHGSWHVYRPGERWQAPAHRAELVIETPPFVAVCFSPSMLALVKDPEKPVEHLGPDILAAEIDALEIRRRLRERPAVEIGAGLLDQTALAGVGNIYKSESLWRAKIDPFTAIADLPDEALDRVVEAARALMRGSALAESRRPAQRAVYRRGGKACPRCGATIRRAIQNRRSTWWCPGCQHRA